jgi:hypothetical protein
MRRKRDHSRSRSPRRDRPQERGRDSQAEQPKARASSPKGQDPKPSSRDAKQRPGSSQDEDSWHPEILPDWSDTIWADAAQAALEQLQEELAQEDSQRKELDQFQGAADLDHGFREWAAGSHADQFLDGVPWDTTEQGMGEAFLEAVELGQVRHTRERSPVSIRHVIWYPPTLQRMVGASRRINCWTKTILQNPLARCTKSDWSAIIDQRQAEADQEQEAWIVPVEEYSLERVRRATSVAAFLGYKGEIQQFHFAIVFIVELWLQRQAERVAAAVSEETDCTDIEPAYDPNRPLVSLLDLIDE